MKLKRIMAIVLCIAMVLSTMSFNVFAESETVTDAATLKTALESGGTVVLGSDITVEEMIKIPAATTVTLDLNGNSIISGYQEGFEETTESPKHIYPFDIYGNLTIKDETGDGSVSGRGIFLQDGAKLTVESGSIYGIDSNGGSAIFMYGGKLDINGGHIEQDAEGTYNFAVNALAGIVTVDGGWIGGNHGAIACENAKVVLNNGTFVCTGTPGMTDNVLYSYGSGSITINNGTFIADNDGPAGGCCVYDSNGSVVVNNGNFSNSSGGDVWGTTGTTIKGGNFENLIETTHVVEGATIVNGGKTMVKTEDSLKEAVAVINGTIYSTFDEALEAAKSLTGDVTVEILGKVSLKTSIGGSFDSIKFVGKNDNAEIYMDIQGYIEAPGKKVAFEDLKLSKVAGGYVANAGFMNLAFGIYAAKSVSYEDCVFLNGAYSSGDTTFEGCTFYSSHDRYGLWVYGDTSCVVDECIFDDIRGIKVYHEGKLKTADLTVKNTEFTEKVNGKPAIVLTNGKSVTLENNTYSSTGVFELDLDGNPNGTVVTSDVAPTCKNDNGACGVLVDGKIYTTVADAAEVAEKGSEVTLLHNSTETVELPKGVILDKNGFTADGVTVETPVATIGTTEYKTIAEAIKAAKDGDVVTILPGEYGAIDISNKNITVQGTVGANGELLTTIKGGNPAIAAHGFNGTIKDIKIVDAFKAMYAEPAGNVTVDNVYVEGATYGLHLVAYSKDLTWTIQNSYMDLGWANSLGVYGDGYADVIFKNNRFESTNPYYPDYGALAVNTFLPSLTVENNIFGEGTKIAIDAAVTDTSKISIANNYHADGVKNAFAEDSDVTVPVYLYYTEVDNNGNLAGFVDAREAEINGVKYITLEEAFAAAQEGETITLLTDATPALTSQRAITKAAVIDLNGKTLTLTEDDLYFGTTTFKNGTIVVDEKVNVSTAVFWMFKDQTLTFDNVKVVATGVDGTYLIGLDGNNADLNIINGSEIVVDNDTALDLDIICVNATTGNDILVENSKVNVKNLDGRVFFRGNYTISGDSEIYLDGVTKAGFRIEANQTLSITDNAKVTVAGEPRDGGIHIAGGNATYTVADTAEVKATVKSDAVATIGNVHYASLQAAFDAANDGDEIEVISDVVINKDTRTHNTGSYYDGIYYIGDKSFTVDLNGFTITQDGSVNDYLLNFKNDGTKANTITLKNGTLNAGTDAFCAICTSSTSTQQITINLEDVTLINNKSNGSTAKIRGGAVLNVKKGTVIKGLNSYLGIECVASTVNIYDGAEIYQNGTSSDLGGLVGACGNGVVNVYGGYGKSAKCGFVAMTSGGTINVHGGEWISNTDGSIGDNSNLYVLTSQNNSNESGYTGASIINVTGGTFFGGMDAWILNAGLNEVAELNITGGNFNADPVHYVESGYECKKVGNIIKVVKSATSATVKASAATSTVKAGDKVTVQVIAEGFDFTNGDWELRYDPTMFELDAAATTYYKDTTKGVEAQSVNSADENTLAGKVIAVGGSLKQGNEIPSGTVLATYTFTVLPQSKDTVTGKFDIVNAHINTYDYAISQTNVPATTVDFDITITRENRNITGSLDVATPTYNGDFQKGNVFVVDDSVVGKDGAVITYSTEENGVYTTELPTFKKAGSYKIWVKVNVDGYAEYKAELDYMVIGKKDIELSLEVAAGAAYNKVDVKPVITGVCDTEFNGTLTVSGVNYTYTKNDFIYMGNGLAIAKEAKAMDVVAGSNTVTITYTAADKDNYAGASEITNVDADKAFATQAIVDSLNAAANAAVTYTYNGTEHKAQDKIVAPDGWTVTVTRISDGKEDPGVTNVADKEFVEIRFTHDNYNDVVVSRVLKVEPLDLTITVPDFEKGAGEADDFTTKSVTYTSDNFVSSAEFASIDDLVATAGLNVSIVRKTLGEADGNYDITAAYTPNDNYVITVDDGKLTIGMPSDTKIEVVNNTLNGNGNSSADYVAGYKLVLVYTNTATARYTYDDKEMFDLSNAGYEYFDNTKSIADQTDDNYKYVYGIIVKAEGTAEDAYYADKVDFIGTNKYKPEKIVYDADINYDDKFSPNDISAANGVLNVENELDAFFMYYFLKADYDRTADGEYKSDKMVKLFDVQEVQKFINTKTTIQ